VTTSAPTSTDGPSNGRAATYALVALVLGLAFGIAASASASRPVLTAVGVIEPLGTLWVNAIRMTVIPLIVSSLLVAVSSTEARTVGRLGTRAFVVFVALLSLLAIFAAVVTPPLFNTLSIDPAAAASIRASAAPVDRPDIPSFVNWLVSLVPPNPFKAAADGAMLPLVVFTLAFGLALGRVQSAGSRAVVEFFRAVAEAMTILVRWILALAPIGVFALALTLATRLGSSVIGAVGFYLVSHSLIHVAATILIYIVVALFARAQFGRFVRAVLPAQIVGMSTRSSMAALPILFTAADRELHLPRTVTSFALPLATSTFRLNQPTTWVVMAMFAAKLYGVDLSTTAVITLAVTAVLMSFSVPGIPSGGLFIIAPFFISAGIPAEAVGVLIALDLLPDVFKTLLNVTGQLAAVTLISKGEATAEPESSLRAEVPLSS